jgi:hypothetical protein
MNLINYLNNNYFTKQQLLDLAKITETELLNFQQQNVMPKCSYKLKLHYTSHSFFGEFNDQSEIEYYAKGYLSWLGILKVTEDPQTVFNLFALRYTKAITYLKNSGHHSDDNTVNSALNLHIKQEWKSFLEGIYGLCTHSGLPEDIAAKEVAILQINEMLALDETEIDLTELTKAVNLLDKSSAMFAPHERLKSSRHRLVDEVRRLYTLTR